MSEIAKNTVIFGVTLIGSWVGGYFLNAPAEQTKVINELRAQVISVDTKIDKVCTYSTNQVDRMDKNLQLIGKALQIDVVTGFDRDNPCN